MPNTVTGYCHQCETEREILLTVPWQDDTCKRCGSTDVTTKQEA
jgi:glycerol-3-phosphate dehydrogenase